MSNVQFTGYTNKTPERYFIDAGAIYLNLEFDATTGECTGGDLLGATEGGNEFKVEQKTRETKVDGLKGTGKGNTIIISEEATLKVNLKELTAKNISMALAGGTIDTTSNKVYDIITTKGKIELTDYTDNIALVGRKTGSNNPIIIILENVLSVEGLQIKTEDDNEVVVPILFKAHYTQNNIDTQTAPFKIYFPKEPAV